MDKILAKIDSIIEKIPIHIRDLIQKAFLAIVALVALLGIVYGIRKGIENARPGGAELFSKNKDLFYIDGLREENKKKNHLVEDVEVYQDLFESKDERIHPTFRRLGKETEDRMIGEREEFIKNKDPLRKKSDTLFMDDTKKDEPVLPDQFKSGEKTGEVPLIDDSSQNSSTASPVMNRQSKEPGKNMAPEPENKPESNDKIQLID